VITPHVFPERHLRMLAAGGGGRTTISLLLAGQFSKRILLIRAVRDLAWRAGVPGAAQSVDAAYELLASVQRVRPGIVRAAVTLPHVGIWATSCLRGETAQAENTGCYLAAVAAAAALRARQEFQIDVPVRDGAVSLPGIGTAVFGEISAGSAQISGTRSGAVIMAAGRQIRIPAAYRDPAPDWWPARILRASASGHELVVLLDDTDPYRAPAELLDRPSLTPDQVRHWNQMLHAAWRLLTRRHQGQVQAMASGLRVLVPLHRRGAAQRNSATAMDAFGTVMLTAPTDGPGLAHTLLHEFQHGKLAALQDLVVLHTDRSEPLFYAPWRGEPRPLGILLQGAYAHLAVTAFWRAQVRQVTGAEADRAQAQFAYWRTAVSGALEQLLDSGELTAAGERFVAGMSATLSRWHTEPLPARACRLAADHDTRDRMTWRMRHLIPDPAAVDRLARSWLADAPPPLRATLIESSLHPAQRVQPGLPRQHSTADLAYARGQYATAQAAYLAELAADPAALSGWAGLALTSRRLADGDGEALLTARPEVTRALYLRILALSGTIPDPVALTAWLATSTACDTVV
jgi:HEXXH motif-containing protein